MSASNDNKAIENAGEVIKKFGGIRPMAGKLGVPVTTVQGWKKRDVIPGNRRSEVIDAANQNNIDISAILYKPAKTEPQRAEENPAQQQSAAVQPESQAIPKAPQQSTQQTPNPEYVTMQDLQAAEKAATRKSIYMTVIVLAVLGALTLFLIGPDDAKRISQDVQKVSEFGERIQKVEERQTMLESMIPENLKTKVDELVEETQTIQQQVQLLASDVVNSLSRADFGSLQERLDQVERSLQALGNVDDAALMVGKFKAMQASMEGQDVLEASVDDLRNIVGGLQGQVTDLSGALEQAKQDNDELAVVLEDVSGEDLKAAAMLIALNEFRSSVHRNTPFSEDLALLKKIVGDDDPVLLATIDRLAPHAERGVLSPEGLEKEFSSLSGDIVMAKLQGEDVSVRDKALERLGNLITITKESDLVPMGNSTETHVARAQAFLDKGDIRAARMELAKLDGEEAEAAKPWMDKADAYLNTEIVQNAVMADVIKRLSSGRSFSSVQQLIDILNAETPMANRSTEDMPAPPGQNKLLMDKDSGINLLRRHSVPQLPSGN